MAASRSGLRPQSLTGRPPRANWMARAVPQDPAPSTATGARADRPLMSASPATPRAAFAPASVGDGRLPLVGSVQRVEIHGREQELRKAALAHELRDGRTRVGEQHSRADGADGTLQIRLGEIADDEEARLLHLDEEDGRITVLGGHGDRQHHLPHLRTERGGAGLQVEVDLRVPVAIDARPVRRLVRAVLEVDVLQCEHHGSIPGCGKRHAAGCLIHVSGLRLLQQGIQAPILIERLKVIGSADVGLTDENLRYGIAAAASAHLLARPAHRFDIDLLDGDPFVCEEAPCACTVRAPVRDVHDDLRRTHGARGRAQARDSGRLSARQAESPPRSANTRVKPWAASWRTAAAPSEPLSSYTTTVFSLCFFSVSPALTIWSLLICRAPFRWPDWYCSSGRRSSTSAPWFISRITSCGDTERRLSDRMRISYIATRAT